MGISVGVDGSIEIPNFKKLSRSSADCDWWFRRCVLGLRKCSLLWFRRSSSIRACSTGRKLKSRRQWREHAVPYLTSFHPPNLVYFEASISMHEDRKGAHWCCSPVVEVSLASSGTDLAQENSIGCCLALVSDDECLALVSDLAQENSIGCCLALVYDLALVLISDTSW